MLAPALDHSNIRDRFYGHEFPELGQGPISVEPYISEAFFEKERELIFKRHWLKVCHEVEIPKPGDFMIKDIAILRASIIITRGMDGVVRAFHNVCKHRGNKLVCVDKAGKAGAFVCKFHGWSYATDGTLRVVPEKDRFLDLDKKTLGLTPVTMDMWRGWIFIHAQENPDQTLADHMGSLGEDLNPYPFEQMRLISSYETRLKTNWKVGVNAFQESYHVPTVHAVIAPSLYTARANCFRFHGKSRSVSLPTNPDFKPSPVEKLGGKLSFGGQSQNAVVSLDSNSYPGINPNGIPYYGFDINVVFPSSFIDVGQGWFFIYEFWPIAVDEVDFVMKLYLPPATSWSQRIGQELTVIQLRDVVREDLSTLESTQAGLMSGAIKEMTLSDQELNVRHQHRIVEEIVYG